MDQLEKVEKLRQRAEVSYEEAKEALEASSWDLLDAMVYLEKAGKTKGLAKESYSTSYEEQEQYVSVKDKVNEQKESGENIFKKLGRLIGTLIRKSGENDFVICRKNKEILCIPVWGFAIALLIWWELLIPLILIGLFLDCRYSFRGKDDLSDINRAMEDAGKFAEKVKDEYERS